MIRRTVLALAVVLGAVALSSCSSTEHPNAVATVDGAVLTRDDLDQLVNSKVVQDMLQMEAPTDETVDLASQADRVISVWIVLEAVSAHEAAQLDDEAPASSVLAAAGTEYEQSFATATGATRDLIVRYIAFQTLYQAGTLDNAAMRTAVQTADIHVDSRYGYWNPDKASVIPFGSDADSADTTDGSATTTGTDATTDTAAATPVTT